MDDSKPRLQDWFLDKQRCEKLYGYMSSTEYDDDSRSRDFFDKKAYQRICDLYGGEDRVQDDIFLAVSTEGFQALRNKSYDVWPIASIVCNLAPHLRFSVKNVLLFAFVPGPSEPSNLQSFMEPLLKEIEYLNTDGGYVFQFYDGIERKVRVHILWVTGDFPAVKKLSGVKRHNGKLPCRFCTIEGIWCPAHRHNYYPIKVSDGGKVSERYDVEFLPQRTVENLQPRLRRFHLSSASGKQSVKSLQVYPKVQISFDYQTCCCMCPFRSMLCISSTISVRTCRDFRALMEVMTMCWDGLQCAI